MLNALKTLLLLALLAITGEAAAMHCGSEDGHGQHSETQIVEQVQVAKADPHRTMAAAEKAAHCRQGQCEGAHTASSPHQDCDGSCNCCPGHCANVIPVSMTVAEFISFIHSQTAYRPLDSTPAPESTIRPPIPA
ncbi:hypothetical protein [Microbulbifer pacificus]|uniref:hypothetical protein n=1 Tax=Microbulbifer pacificus TaxID=407164 RepID=UPI000CF4806B|nr:hypothetical protein [Microbulbifer pacificus]